MEYETEVENYDDYRASFHTVYRSISYCFCEYG